MLGGLLLMIKGVKEMERYNITKGTITRTVILVLALINQGLTMFGHSPIPIEDEALTEFIAYGVTIITALIAWWKNNSYTQKAIKADSTFK